VASSLVENGASRYRTPTDELILFATLLGIHGLRQLCKDERERDRVLPEPRSRDLHRAPQPLPAVAGSHSWTPGGWFGKIRNFTGLRAWPGNHGPRVHGGAPPARDSAPAR
jgi:hypothetical protein